MPGMARVVLPNCPHSVVQRSYKSQVVLAEKAQFTRCLNDLCEFKGAPDVRVYSSSQTSSHIHLLHAP